MPHLIWLFITPFFSAIVLLLLPFSGRVLKQVAVFLSLLPLAMLIGGHANWIGSHVIYSWFPALSIHFHLSVDSLSLIFLYLTAIIVPISVVTVRSETSNPHFFYALILFVQGLLIGFFTARDLVVFTIFYESMLIPLYFIITIWGGQQRELAGLKFIIYMIAGSTLMVAAVLSLYFVGAKSFDIDALRNMPESIPYATAFGAIFLLAFAVKTPLFPFHAWLPDAYYQAPTAGTILLAGLLSKAGIYGILRISMEIFPWLIQRWSPILIGLAIAGVLYGALSAWLQNDFKRLIAYSSFSHVNFILVGLFVWSQASHSGAILQAFNHGITITALFLVADWLQQRIGSTRMGHVSGVATYLPHLCWLTLFFVLSSVALPGTNNFVGELLILFGLFVRNPWLAATLGLSIIFSVAYMLRWMQKIYFEESGPQKDIETDIKLKEWIIALPLILIILFVGIYPAPLLKETNAASDKIEMMETSK
jgi:NADH-quinone oxidoreductase subunit M